MHHFNPIFQRLVKIVKHLKAVSFSFFFLFFAQDTSEFLEKLTWYCAPWYITSKVVHNETNGAQMPSAQLRSRLVFPAGLNF